ncbi:VMAP-C domain-containing protein [Streptomyces daliensis]
MTGARLEALARTATVRLGPEDADGTLWGSGFFVAPGWVLTCLHVVRERLGPDGGLPFAVHGAGGLRVGARLGYRLPAAQDGDQDLALVRLLDDVPHPCVWLTDRGDKPARVAAYGWRVPKEGQAPQEWSGNCAITGSDGPYGMMLGPETEVPHGASGGPVVDRDHGSVVGVVKARRRGRDGGLAIATTALRGFETAEAVGGENGLGPDPYERLIRAHDEWHDGCGGPMAWTPVQPEHGRWRPSDRTRALALLAALPRPGGPATVGDVLRTVLGEEQPWLGVAPRTWRDGHGRLYESDETGDEMSFLHYLLLAARTCRAEEPEEEAAGPVERLECWVRDRAAQLVPHHRALLENVLARPGARGVRGAREEPGAPGPDRNPDPDAVPGGGPSRRGGAALGAATVSERAAAGPGDEGPVVAVELEPAHYPGGGRFYWRVWVWTEGPESVRSWAEGESGEGTALHELPYRLSEPLRTAFGRLDTGRRRARLEVVLPVEHFDIDVHLWRAQLVVRSMRPHPAERPFGVHRQVVLRDLARRGGAPGGAWEARWEAVTERCPQALPVRAEGDVAFGTAEADAVPVLCRPASESVVPLREAIRAGHGLALWNRTARHTYGCDGECERLHEATAKLLRQSGGAGALPEELRVLRERVNGEDADAYWAEHLALLFDDPGRPVPGPPATVVDCP